MVKSTRLYLFISISILLIILDYFSVLNPVREPLDGIIVPVKIVVYTSIRRTADTYRLIADYSRIKSETENLKDLSVQIDQLKEQVRQLTAENTKYRMQLDTPLPASYKYIPSRVISVGKNMEIWSGSKNGVASGMTVVDRDFYIGRITRATPFRSLVQLPFDKDSVIPSKTSRGTRGNVTGDNSMTVLMDKILQKDPLFLDDLVVTTGEGGYLPNLVIGKIKHIDADDVSVYKKAQIVPPVEYNSLELVFVVDAL